MIDIYIIILIAMGFNNGLIFFKIKRVSVIMIFRLNDTVNEVEN